MKRVKNPNTLTAFCYLIENNMLMPKVVIKPNGNRANHVGDRLEAFIQNAFANVDNSLIPDIESGKIDKKTQDDAGKTRFELVRNHLFIPGVNEMPDMMLKKGGDAIEVKKSENASAFPPLNSSYPKQFIRVKDYERTDQRVTFETWSRRRHVLYVVGHVKTDIKSLWLVYGDCFAANSKVYEKLLQAISESTYKTVNRMITKDSPFELVAESREVARINKVDPLERSTLRLRAMWEISHPKSSLSEPLKVLWLGTKPPSAQHMVLLLRSTKYDSFPKESRDTIEKMSESWRNNNALPEVRIYNIAIPDPDDRGLTVPAKAIIYVQKGTQQGLARLDSA